MVNRIRFVERGEGTLSQVANVGGEYGTDRWCSMGREAASALGAEDELALPFPRTVANSSTEDAIKQTTCTCSSHAFLLTFFFLPLLLGVKYLGRLLQVSWSS